MQFADSGGLVIRKRQFAIVDTHELAYATPLPSKLEPHGNRIHIKGHRRGVNR